MLVDRFDMPQQNGYRTRSREQHGFRAELSTWHQLLRVIEYIKTGFKDRKSTGVVFLDIQKVFDRVWHIGLLYKLIKINIHPHLIKVISSYLCNRTFSVRVNNIHSSNKPVQCGVPQGSLLASALFNIYVNDIPRTSQTTTFMYADDISICAQKDKVQSIGFYQRTALPFKISATIRVLNDDVFPFDVIISIDFLPQTQFTFDKIGIRLCGKIDDDLLVSIANVCFETTSVVNLSHIVKSENCEDEND
ncbi:RNA-directed DNA polymerase from mobile element jockey [Trichonephila clavipes]|nr:RNA-directed DNA polymerase from mobile element jockey [Trichonephila clavipes]